MLIATFALSVFYVSAKYLFSTMLGMGWVNTIAGMAVASAAATGIYSIAYGVHLWLAYLAEAFILSYTTLLEVWSHKSGHHHALLVKHHARKIAKSRRHLSRFNREMEKIEKFAEKPIHKLEKEFKGIERFAIKPMHKLEKEFKAIEKFAEKPIHKAEEEMRAIIHPVIKAEEEVGEMIFRKGKAHKGRVHSGRSTEVDKIIKRIMKKERHRKLFEKVPYKKVEELHKSRITKKSKKNMDLDLHNLKRKIDKLKRFKL
jgi:hypothetical protein